MLSGTPYAEANIFLGTLAMTQPRMLAAFAMLPVFNRQLLPGMLRYAMCAALGLVLVPALAPHYVAGGTQGIGLMLIITKEIFIGLALGFLFAIPFWVFECVGFLIDAQRGASIGVALNPATGNETSPLGMLFNQAFMVFFLVGGGFTLMLSILYDSYVLWNIWTFYPDFNAGDGPLLLQQLSRMMQLTVLFAAPALIAMFLAELGLGLVNRFAPQLQVFFLAMPIKSALAILVLVLYTQALFDYGSELLTHLRDTLPFYDQHWRQP